MFGAIRAENCNDVIVRDCVGYGLTVGIDLINSNLDMADSIFVATATVVRGRGNTPVFADNIVHAEAPLLRCSDLLAFAIRRASRGYV